MSLRWHHNGRDGVSDHQPHDCLLSSLFMRRSKKTSKLRVTGLCEGNSPVTGEFPSQTTSKTENISIWWRHRVRMDLRWRKIEAATFHAPRLFHYGVLTHWGLWKIARHFAGDIFKNIFMGPYFDSNFTAVCWWRLNLLRTAGHGWRIFLGVLDVNCNVLQVDFLYILWDAKQFSFVCRE